MLRSSLGIATQTANEQSMRNNGSNVGRLCAALCL